jgi:hypothetical protein
MTDMRYEVAQGKVEECSHSYILSWITLLEDGPEPDEPVLLLCKLKDAGGTGGCDRRDCPLTAQLVFDLGDL